MDYDGEFFDHHADGALRSARVIAPLIVDLLAPRSVIDVGCGTGAWLRVIAECGVGDVVGIDGDYVDRNRLLIPADRFLPADLTRPPSLGRRFELAVCLEVLEHLPARFGPPLVRYLTDLAPVVLFSAAVPGQGGTHHVNERWPWYWERLFAEVGMVRIDFLRPRIWREPAVEHWYKTNIAVYANEAVIRDNPRLSEELRLTRENPFELMDGRVLREGTGSPRRLVNSLISSILSLLRLRRHP